MKKILFLVLTLSINIFSQEFRFVREDINFRIDTEYFYVEGYYWFVNLSDKQIKKEIYFPVSLAGGEIDSVEVCDVNRFIYPGIHNFSANGFGFTAQILPDDTAIYKIKYRQEIRSDSAAYILLSTQQWSHKLELAEYKLILNKTISLSYATYEYDKIYNVGEDTIYYWKRERFMPDRDMVFYFNKIK